MLSGEFERKLRRLNRDLKIYCGDDKTKPAGIYRFKHSQYDDLTRGYDLVCGVDKNWVGEHAEWRSDGRLARSGWRRVLRILIQQRLIDRRDAEHVFNTHLPYAARKLTPPTRKLSSAISEQLVMKRGSY